MVAVSMPKCPRTKHGMNDVKKHAIVYAQNIVPGDLVVAITAGKMGKMVNIVNLIVLLTATKAVCVVAGVEDCPPWFEWVNSSDSAGYCACAVEIPNLICDQRKQTSWISQGSSIFYNEKKGLVGTDWCPFLFPDSAIKNGLFPLPANVSELNSVVCGNLSREVKGPLCGRCTNGTGPSIYSVGSRCVHCSPVNILYYLLLQYLPSTVIFLLVIIFRPNITSAPMANYVIFCNYTVISARVFLWRYIQTDLIKTWLVKLTLTLSSIWSFDAFLFISPPLCISKHMEEVYIPFLEFLATIYPFLLLLATYGMIEMHTKNFKPIVALWRLISSYRAWDPRSSMIQAFASLFFLSYAKLTYLIWEAFLWGEVKRSDKGHTNITVLFIDPNVPYLSTKHILLMAFSVGVAVFLFLPLLLILAVYPTSLYRKISHRIQPKWRLRIKTYVETFHSCFKDGTNGTRDYRSFSGLFILLLGLVPQLLMVIVTVVTNNNVITRSYVVAIFISGFAFFCALLQPYKENSGNSLTTGILVIISLTFAIAAGIYDNRKREGIKVIMIILILVPHSVLWGHVVFRSIKYIITYCHRYSRDAKGKREKPLYGRVNVNATDQTAPHERQQRK